MGAGREGEYREGSMETESERGKVNMGGGREGGEEGEREGRRERGRGGGSQRMRGKVSVEGTERGRVPGRGVWSQRVRGER